MAEDTIRTALIYGSVREGRFCDRVAAWAGGQVWQRRGFSLEIVDPARRPDPTGQRPSAKDLQTRLTRADAFVVVTPEYNHSFSASLKAFVDSAFSAWQAKPVAFVSYGGISGGLRAVEQLRLVFAELRAVTIRDSVSFANPWERFDDHGNLSDARPAEVAMDRLLTQLGWWARALKQARHASAYANADA